MINKEELIKLTRDYGGNWGVNHSERLLHLIDMLGRDISYDQEVIWLAAYLHDWGGYEKWAVPGVWHADRSREVADKFLSEQGLSEDKKQLVLECIEFHHGGPENRSIESILFANADALDLLGALGMLRIFAMNPRSLRNGYEAAKRYREMSVAAITLDSAQEMASERLAETDKLLELFEKESFGIF